MGAAIFNDGVPVGLGDGGAGVCAHGSRKDGTCRQQPEPELQHLAAASEEAREDTPGAADAEVNAVEEGGKSRGGGSAVSVDLERLQAHCVQFNGVFAHQCERVAAALWPKLKKKKDKRGKVTVICVYACTCVRVLVKFETAFSARARTHTCVCACVCARV